MSKALKNLKGQVEVFNELFTPSMPLRANKVEGMSRTLYLKTNKEIRYQHPFTGNMVVVPKGTPFHLYLIRYGRVYSTYNLHIRGQFECTNHYGNGHGKCAYGVPSVYQKCPHSYTIRGVILTTFSVFLNQFTQCDGNDGKHNDWASQQRRANSMGIRLLTPKEVEDEYAMDASNDKASSV